MPVTWGPNLIRTGAGYQNGRSVVQRTYQTKADTELEAQAAVLARSAPSGMIVKDISTSRASDESRTVWTSEVSYGYGDTSQSNPNPMARPAEVDYGRETWTEDYFKDSTGKRVVNFAGEPYDTMPMRQRSCMVLTVTKNIDAAAFNPLTLETIADTVNAKAVQIKGITYPAGTLLMTAPTAKEQYEGVHHYYSVTYTLKARADGWSDHIAEVGYHQLISGNWVEMTTDWGSPINLPWALNPDGTKRSSGETIFTEYKPYTSNPWTGISFA